MTITKNTTTLDPSSWADIKKQGHQMLDDLFDFLENIRKEPVWQPIPDKLQTHFTANLPTSPTSLESVYQEFLHYIRPFLSGNTHPGFMGFAQGASNPAAILAEMLAAGINANLGGREHMPIYVEQQITLWVQQMLGFANKATGQFVTGASLANFIAVLIARTRILGTEVRQTGLQTPNLKAYTSHSAHHCVAKAFEMSGLGSHALCKIPTNENHQISIAALVQQIKDDMANGFKPFMVIGNAGTVDTGAVDDLSALSDLCKTHQLWFHVDGAYGALGLLSSKLAPLFQGIEHADSVALDFHKWGQVPYEAGFIITQHPDIHKATFASQAAYLPRKTHGLSAGNQWPCDYGPNLSRGFQALKTWFTLKTYGTDHLARMMEFTCTLAQYLEHQILEQPNLELLAPVNLNIVCFRYQCNHTDKVNRDIVIALQESGIVAPSSTTVNGVFAIRAAFFNHRSTFEDVDNLIRLTLQFGQTLSAQ